MAVSQNDLDWFAARLMIAVYDTNKEYRMSVQVQALTEVVRQAKLAIATASTAAVRMSNSAARVVDRVAQVEGMIKELDSAEAELGAALGQMSNGGPPLDDGVKIGVDFGTTPSVVVVTPAETIDSSIVKVQALNAPAA
jgi:hypothetical protein